MIGMIYYPYHFDLFYLSLPTFEWWYHYMRNLYNILFGQAHYESYKMNFFRIPKAGILSVEPIIQFANPLEFTFITSDQINHTIHMTIDISSSR